MALVVKNPAANAGGVRDAGLIPELGRSLGWEDTLEEEMTTHSSVLAWEIPCVEEPGGLQSMGSQRIGHELVTRHFCPWLCWVFAATRGFCLVATSRGSSPAPVHELLTALAPLVAEHGL